MYYIGTIYKESSSNWFYLNEVEFCQKIFLLFSLGLKQRFENINLKEQQRTKENLTVLTMNNTEHCMKIQCHGQCSMV